MPIFFLDTSALVKRYHPEAGTHAVDQIFDDPKASLWISRLGLVEVVSAFVQKVRSGVISTDDGEQYRRQVMRDIRQQKLRVVRMLVRQLHLADKLLRDHGGTHRLRTLDAIQLAVAADLNSIDGPTTFVCSDQDLTRVASLIGLAVLDPLGAQGGP